MLAAVPRRELGRGQHVDAARVILDEVGKLVHGTWVGVKQFPGGAEDGRLAAGQDEANPKRVIGAAVPGAHAAVPTRRQDESVVVPPDRVGAVPNSVQDVQDFAFVSVQYANAVLRRAEKPLAVV